MIAIPASLCILLAGMPPMFWFARLNPQPGPECRRFYKLPAWFHLVSRAGRARRNYAVLRFGCEWTDEVLGVSFVGPSVFAHSEVLPVHPNGEMVAGEAMSKSFSGDHKQNVARVSDIAISPSRH